MIQKIHFFFLGLFFLAGVSLRSQEHVSRIEAYGASFTSGFLSETQYQTLPDLSMGYRILFDSLEYMITGNFDISSRYEITEKTWAYKLHREIVKEQEGSDINFLNHAFSGARVTSFLDQLSEAPMPANHVESYFMMGGNDLCHISAISDLEFEYRHHLKLLLEQWDLTHQNSRAMFMEVFPIEDIMSRYARNDFIYGLGISCYSLWKISDDLCPLLGTEFTPEKAVEFLKPRREVIHQVIRELVTSFQSQNGNEVFFLSDLEYEVHDKDLAIDCAHLSAHGQEYIKDLVIDWRNQNLN